MAPRKFISLQFSMAAAFALTVLATSGLIGASTFFATRNFLRTALRHRLEDIGTLAAARFDAATHAKIRTREDENSPAYASIKKYLREVKAASDEIRFVYTYRIDAAGKITFVVDAEDPTSPDMSHVGDDYTEAPPLAREAWKAGAPMRAAEDFAKDKWGVWLSTYGPVMAPSGRLECGLGIDISAQTVKDQERQLLYTIAGLSAVTCVILLLAGVWYSRRVSRPLLLLADDLGRVQRLELSEDAAIESTVREVVVMTEAIHRMKNSLRSFRKYVPADLVADLMAMGQEAKLTADKREVTIFFSDIADFTTISEKTLPEKLVEELAVYFDGMTRGVIENHGTVDKFIGDAIMAFWGAPRPLAEHAEYACRAALRCRDYSRQLGLEQTRAGKLPMLTRIGLNTGTTIIGNIGYDERLNYTAMGDAVNLASRLEGLNKYYGTLILISETTQALVAEKFATRLVDVVAVKGKAIPIRIYELIGEQGATPAEVKAKVQSYEEAFALYLQRDFHGAAERWQRLLATFPDDAPAQLLLARAHEYLATPPPPEWSGAYTMKSK